MQSTIGSLITWFGGLVCFGGGGWLVIRGLMDFIKACSADPKKLGDILKGLGVAFGGGLLVAAGFGWFYAFAKSKGNEVPHN